MPRFRTPTPRRAPLRPAAAGALLAVVLAVPPSEPAQAQGILVEPSVSAQQTVTNNASLNGGEGRSDAITQVTPGVRISGKTGRTSGTLDYRLDAVAYARDSDRSELRNRLSADARTQLVDDHVFLDAAASISQQSISAFGQQTAGTGLTNDNTSEFYSVTVSPRATTRLAGLLDVDANARWTTTRSNHTALGDATNWDAAVGIGASHGMFGWNASATRQSSDYDDGSRLVSDSLTGTLSAALTSRLKVFVRGGRERADYYGGGNADWSTSSGWGADWQPTPRTQLAFSSDDRYYGRSHSFSLSHRFRRAIVSYSDSRGIGGENTDALGPFREAYLRVYTVCMATISNPLVCTQYARAFFGFDPTQSLGFLNSAPSLQRTQALALALTGVRNSFSMTATRTINERLDDMNYVGGDLAIAPRVRQQGLTFAASHRLTPVMSLSASLSLLRTLDEPELAGNTQGLSGNDQRRVELGVSNDFGARTSGSLSVRHVRFDSDTNPYRESALIGSLNHRF